MTQKSPPVNPRETMKPGTNKTGGSSAIEFKGTGSKGVGGANPGARAPSPKAAQIPRALQSERKSDDRAAKRGRGNPDK